MKAITAVRFVACFVLADFICCDIADNAPVILRDADESESRDVWD
jgi:hypothetical protein